MSFSRELVEYILEEDESGESAIDRIEAAWDEDMAELREKVEGLWKITFDDNGAPIAEGDFVKKQDVLALLPASETFRRQPREADHVVLCSCVGCNVHQSPNTREGQQRMGLEETDMLTMENGEVINTYKTPGMPIAWSETRRKKDRRCS